LQGRRQKIILASKCGRYGKGVDECDYSARCVIAGIDESLLRLKTDYVDLIQVHDVEMVLDPEQVIHETIPALRRVVKAGKARWVGITGLPLKLLRYVAAKVEVDTVLSFCHYNLMITDLDESLAPHCQSANIGLINASPLHMGLLTTKGGPEWHPAICVGSSDDRHHSDWHEHVSGSGKECRRAGHPERRRAVAAIEGHY